MTINVEIEYVKRLEKELKETREFFVDKFKENEKLKQQIEELTSENFELQNDLFTQQLNEDETDDYIDSLKNELFQVYINK